MVSPTIMNLDTRPCAWPALAEPFRQRAVRLEPQPEPCNALLASRLTNVAPAYLKHHGREGSGSSSRYETARAQ
jgi:hypothetical protein